MEFCADFFAKFGLFYAAGGVVRLPRPSGRRPLCALVAPLMPAPAGRLGPPSGTPGAVVTLSDPERGPHPPATHLRALYGLTAAEARLLQEMAAGYSLRQAAERLGVTRETARTQLKRIYHKTATRRQAKLVKAVLQNPAAMVRA